MHGFFRNKTIRVNCYNPKIMRKERDENMVKMGYRENGNGITIQSNNVNLSKF